MPQRANTSVSVNLGHVQSSTVILSGGDARTTHARARLPQPANPALKRLAQVLRTHFSLDELRELCFEIGVEYEDLPAQTRTGKARELALRADALGLRPALIAAIIAARPSLNALADQLTH
jgi:hypothetical protein